MSELFALSLDDQLAAVKREIAMRERVYPRQVAAGRMTRVTADRELAAMNAVLTTLTAGPALVEREACARLAEGAWFDMPCPDDDSAAIIKTACMKAAALIRERGKVRQ